MTNATYAVIWREAGGDPRLGRLELRGDDVVLTGRDADPVVFGLGEVVGVRVSRSCPGGVGRPTLVVERAHAVPILVEGATGFGVLHELADRLAPRATAV